VLLDQLLTEDLSGITFVRDYLQLEFNPPPRINVYSTCRVVVGAASAEFGDDAFANLIISQIGQSVVAVDEAPDELIIKLKNGARIEIPADPGGPEACVFYGRDNQWGAWPA